MTMHQLLEYQDCPSYHNPAVYALNATTALVKLSGFVITFVPLSDGPNDGEQPETYRKYTAEFIETPASREQEISLGELTLWAMRRIPARSVCEECDAVRRSRDFQRVLGAIFDRCLIRESMQWLFENRITMSTTVRMCLVPTPPEGTRDWHVLRLHCDKWTAVVMCCKPDSEVGTDPLEAS
jgi:hypothetical protein